MNCEFCQSPAHVWFQCPKKPEGWKPVRLAKESTGICEHRSVKPGTSVAGDPSTQSTVGADKGLDHSKVRAQLGVRSSALPVDTNPAALSDAVEPSLAGVEGDKTGTKFNKTAYQKSYMAAWRKGLVGKKYVKEDGK